MVLLAHIFWMKCYLVLSEMQSCIGITGQHVFLIPAAPRGQKYTISPEAQQHQCETQITLDVSFREYMTETA